MVPAAEARGTGAATAITGAMGVDYYANDLVATQTQGGGTRTYTLDPAQNRTAALDDGTTRTPPPRPDTAGSEHNAPPPPSADYCSWAGGCTTRQSDASSSPIPSHAAAYY